MMSITVRCTKLVQHLDVTMILTVGRIYICSLYAISNHIKARHAGG
jgi:hypothetical protein